MLGLLSPIQEEDNLPMKKMLSQEEMSHNESIDSQNEYSEDENDNLSSKNSFNIKTYLAKELESLLKVHN